MNEKKQETKKNDVAEILSRYRAEIDRLKGELDASKMEKISENPYFEDFEANREEVLKFAAEHGLSPQQAYGALFGEASYKRAANTAKKKDAKISALSGSGNAGEDFEEGVLSGSESWAAKKAGMSLADYLKYKKKGN